MGDSALAAFRGNTETLPAFGCVIGFRRIIENYYITDRACCCYCAALRHLFLQTILAPVYSQWSASCCTADAAIRPLDSLWSTKLPGFHRNQYTLTTWVFL